MSFTFAQLKTFKSLNCATCDEPFTATSSGPKAARILDCGRGVCSRCFEEERFPPKKKDKKHRCTPRSDCFKNPNPCYFILELFATKCLKLSPDQKGYLLVDTFPKIDCTVCQEEFVAEDRKPIQLYCNHAVCFRCIQHLRTPTADRKFPHKIICPICRADASYGNDHSSPYYDFFKELPMMNEQLDFMRRIGQQLCQDCGKSASLDDLFNCGDCRFLCCGSCGVRKHKNHDLRDFTKEEMKKLRETSNETKKLIDETIEDFGRHFTAINNEISVNLIKVKEYLVERLDSIRLIPQLQRATQQFQEIRDLQNSLDEVLQSFDKQNEATSIKLKKIAKLVEEKQTEQKASINTPSQS